MTELELLVRNHVYRRFVELGRALRFEEVADELGLAPAETADVLRRLHDGHALVLEPDGSRIRMLNPFSAVPTPHRVEAAGRSWYANCAWDAFGVLGALHSDGRVQSSCPDCAEPIEIEVRDGAPLDDAHIVHVLVPAARWWDDIVFT